MKPKNINKTRKEIDRSYKIATAMEDNFEIDNEEIAKAVKEGNTSGILDNEEGYRISWTLNVEKFER